MLNVLWAETHPEEEAYSLMLPSNFVALQAFRTKCEVVTLIFTSTDSGMAEP